MIATLATSTDPAQLVPGSLEALGRDTDALVGQADALDDAAGQVRRSVVAGWLGSASAGWDQRRPQIADSLTVPGQVYRAAADVLRAHAGALVWARAYAGLWEWVTGIGALIGKFNVVRFVTRRGSCAARSWRY